MEGADGRAACAVPQLLAVDGERRPSAAGLRQAQGGGQREGVAGWLGAAGSEAALRSGRAFLVEAVGNIWDEVTTTGRTSQDRRAELRLAITHGVRLACQAVDIIYNASGATAVLKGNLIQRHFQDMHVMTQHAQARMAYYEMVGRHWLGLPVPATEL